ncbi:NAD(P)-dependent oxidoreductase [Arthrobacter ginkgonis]|uniref:NAD(P)-dependent oxidoreductase n=1 Tax=Arthrobacter ginkgonis TaxID=1630594 RepID=A0ABP7CCQ1_9MICC
MTDPKADLPAVAFIGLGNMGSPMSARLAAAGYPVTGFDLDPAARDRLTEAGGTTAGSAAEAARGAGVVILMLPSSAVVEAVLAEPAVTAALAPGTTVIDMSSSDPLSTRKLAGELAAASVTLIDAPVSGGVKGAENGTLTIMVGGEEAAVERARPLLAQLGSARRAGNVGSGHAIKAINNLLSATHLLATAEGILAGERFGLDPAVMVELINTSSGRSGSTDNKYPNFILPETFDSGFGLRLMLKDMKIATGLARQLGLSSRLGEQAVALWEHAAEALPPAADHTEIARWAAAATRAG